MDKKYVIGILIIVVLSVFMFKNSGKPGKYDDFAQCIVDKGAVMYGAWWCTHCQDQKKEFGKSWKILSEQGGYVECSTAQKTQIEVCELEGIKGYPTWRFSDGSELGGAVSMQSLAQKTNCTLTPLLSN